MAHSPNHFRRDHLLSSATVSLSSPSSSLASRDPRRVSRDEISRLLVGPTLAQTLSPDSTTSAYMSHLLSSPHARDKLIQQSPNSNHQKNVLSEPPLSRIMRELAGTPSDSRIRFLENMLEVLLERKVRSTTRPFEDPLSEGEPAYTPVTLAKGDVDVNRPVDGRAPLEIAVVGGYSTIARLLIQAGAAFKQDMLHRVMTERTQVSASNRFDFLDTVAEALVEAGADVNIAYDGSTPLHLAIQTGSRVALTLLDNGANANAESHSGLPPLYMVMRDISKLKGTDTRTLGRKEFLLQVAGKLIKSGGDVNTRVKGVSVLDLALQTGDMSLLTSLVSEGCDVNIGAPLNHVMAEMNALVDRGESTTPPLSERMIFLQAAAELLIEYNADVDVTRDNISPLGLAVRCGAMRMVRSLLECGADPNVGDIMSWTMLELGKSESDETEIPDQRRIFLEEVMERLVWHGGDVNAVNEKGQTLLDMAVDCNNERIVELFLKEGADVDGDAVLPKMMKSLCDKRKGIGASSSDGGVTSAAGMSFMEKTVLKLITPEDGFSGANVNSEYNGHSMLDLALELENEEIFRRMVDNGADLSNSSILPRIMKHLSQSKEKHSGDKTPSTPGSLIREREKEINKVSSETDKFYIAAAKCLVESGVETSVMFEGKTMLELAIGSGNEELVTLLLDSGKTDINQNCPIVSVLDRLVALRRAAINLKADVVTKMDATLQDRRHADSLPPGRRKELAIKKADETIEELSNRIAKLSVTDPRVRTLEHIASRLLELGARCDIGDSSSNLSPLDFAIQYGNPYIATLVLENGANVLEHCPLNAVVTEMSDCSDVERLEFLENMATILVKKGASVNEVSSSGKSAMMTVLAHGDRNENLGRLAAFFVEKGGNVSDPRLVSSTVEEMLHCVPGDRKRFLQNSLDMMFKAGADVNAIVDNKTLLDRVIQVGDSDFLSEFLGRGADPTINHSLNIVLSEIRSLSTGASSSSIACGNNVRTKSQAQITHATSDRKLFLDGTVSILLASGADPNDASGGSSPLEYAVDIGHEGLFRQLLACGADPNQSGLLFSVLQQMADCATGDSPERNDFLDMVSLTLIESGANVNVSHNGVYPLSLFIRQSNETGVRMLLGKGVSVDAGLPLYFVLKELSSKPTNVNRKEFLQRVVFLLLDRGADPNSCPTEEEARVQGVTGTMMHPFLWALKTGNADIVDAVVRCGADVNCANGSPLMWVMSEFEKLSQRPATDDIESEREFLNHCFYLLLSCKGILLNESDSTGQTALLSSLKIRRIDILKALLDKRADPRQGNPIVVVIRDICEGRGDDVSRNLFLEEAAEMLFAAGADPDSTDLLRNNASLLFTALKHRSVDLVKMLLHAGADVNLNNPLRMVLGLALETKPERNTPAFDFYQNIAQMLVECGADVDFKDPASGLTSLDMAVANLFPLVVTSLIRNGADVNEGYTLHRLLNRLKDEADDDTVAILNQMAVKLIEVGCDPNSEDSSHCKLLDLAVGCGERAIAIVKLLLENGAEYGKAMVHRVLRELATASGGRRHFCEEMAGSLIDSGADVNLRIDGKTPLELAVSASHLNLLKKLLHERNADASSKDDTGRCLSQQIIGELCGVGPGGAVSFEKAKVLSPGDRRSFLESALEEVQKVSPGLILHDLVLLAPNDVVCSLVMDAINKSGANLLAVDPKTQQTALHLACTLGRVDVVKSLLSTESGKQALTMVDDTGASPLAEAIRHNHSELLDVLLGAQGSPDFSIRIDVGGAQLSLLHVAAARCNSKIVTGLLRNKDSLSLLEARGVFGQTPIMSCIISAKDSKDKAEECLNCLRALVAGGADVNARDYDGNTALMLAVKSGDIMCVKLLLQLGADPSVQNGNRHTASDIAASCGHQELYQLLCLDDERGDCGSSSTAMALSVGWSLSSSQDLSNSDNLWLAVFSSNMAAVQGIVGCLKRDALAQGRVVSPLFDNFQRNLLHWACVWGVPSCLAAALVTKDNGLASVTAGDRLGSSPLHYASMYGFKEGVTMLVAAGGKMDLKDNNGRVADEVASSLFIDNDFRPCVSSLHGSSPNPGYMFVQWRRLSDIAPSSPLFIDGADDASIDVSSDCPMCPVMLASALSLSRSRLRSMFVTDKVSADGRYVLKVPTVTGAKEVAIDDWVPVSTVDDDGKNVVQSFGCARSNELCLSLAIKVFAKIYGSYSALRWIGVALPSANVTEAMETAGLSSAISKQVEAVGHDVIQEVVAQAWQPSASILHLLLHGSHDHGVVLSALDQSCGLGSVCDSFLAPLSELWNSHETAMRQKLLDDQPRSAVSKLFALDQLPCLSLVSHLDGDSLVRVSTEGAAVTGIRLMCDDDGLAAGAPVADGGSGEYNDGVRCFTIRVPGNGRFRMIMVGNASLLSDTSSWSLDVDCPDGVIVTAWEQQSFKSQLCEEWRKASEDLLALSDVF